MPLLRPAHWASTDHEVELEEAVPLTIEETIHVACSLLLLCPKVLCMI